MTLCLRGNPAARRCWVACDSLLFALPPSKRNRGATSSDEGHPSLLHPLRLRGLGQRWRLPTLGSFHHCCSKSRSHFGCCCLFFLLHSSFWGAGFPLSRTFVDKSNLSPEDRGLPLYCPLFFYFPFSHSLLTTLCMFMGRRGVKG